MIITSEKESLSVPAKLLKKQSEYSNKLKDSMTQSDIKQQRAFELHQKSIESIRNKSKCINLHAAEVAIRKKSTDSEEISTEEERINSKILSAVTRKQEILESIAERGREHYQNVNQIRQNVHLSLQKLAKKQMSFILAKQKAALQNRKKRSDEKGEELLFHLKKVRSISEQNKIQVKLKKEQVLLKCNHKLATAEEMRNKYQDEKKQKAIWVASKVKCVQAIKEIVE